MNTLEIRDFKDLPIMLNIKQAQAVLGCGRSMIYKLANRPDFPSVRLGKKIYISKNALQRWLIEQEGKGNKEV